MRNVFYLLSIILLPCITALTYVWHDFIFIFLIFWGLFVIGMYNIFQKRRTILRNFPLLAYFRYFAELIRPEVYQYFIESNENGKPISREDRSVVYQRAKKTLDTLPWGTKKDIYANDYQWLAHSLRAKTLDNHDLRIIIGNEQCEQPYNASILNISAMSFGALSQEAVMAMNWGAKIGNFMQNTGEGGVTEYHFKHGGDLTWQIGTAYFGTRTIDGNFDPNIFKEKSRHPSIKMIEIKLSQGAKPGHGGILPADKLTEEIAAIRGVPLGQDVLSPPAHSAFSTPIELLEYIQLLRNLSGGKPIGFKLCLGMRSDFFAICKAMLKTNIYTDFMTLDGGEGGTGAAPIEFSNFVGTPLNYAIPFVYSTLVGLNLKKHIKIIASGKITTAFDVVSKIALGADLCNSARGMMLATGCIMSLQCNNNKCPTGVTSQNPKYRYGLVVKEKYMKVTNYHIGTMKTVAELIGAAGLDSTEELTPHHIHYRMNEVNHTTYDEHHYYFKPGELLELDKSDLIPKNCPSSVTSLLKLWKESMAERFI